MMKILAIILLVFLPICMALNCYTCASGMSGCNDPFNANAYNVTQVSNVLNIYCVKTMMTSSVVSRYGSPSCSSVPFVGGTVGTACCQTDLCNGAERFSPIPSLIIITLLIIR